MANKYIYKIKNGWNNQIIYFYVPSSLNKSLIHLNNGTTQEDLEKLYEMKHPAVSRSKVKEEENEE